MASLNLHITGLCAVVSVGWDVLIVLPNARDYGPDGNPLPPTQLQDQHVPLLCVPDHPASSSARPDSFMIPASSGLFSMDLRAYPLDKEDLELTPVTPKAKSLPGEVAVECPNGTVPSTDFGWVSHMADVEAPTVLTHVLDKVFPADLALVRLRVTNGDWSTEVLAPSPMPGHTGQGDPRYIVHWYYADMNGIPKTGTTSRAITDVIRVTIPIDGPGAMTFKSSAANSDIALDGSDLTAVLVNAPLASLVGSSPGGVRQAEMHFAHFYRLAGKNPTWVPWPDIHGPNCGQVGPGTMLVPHCPPAVFEG